LFIKHAQRYGIDCVYETAAQAGLAPVELAKLKLELQTAAEQHRRARQSASLVGEATGRHRRAPVTLREAGHTAGEIAELIEDEVSRLESARAS
jgi:hypothetical protein